MGASGWHYFAPFQPDIKAALDQLRDEVFATGEYFKPALFYGALMHQVGDQLEPNVVEEVNTGIRISKYLKLLDSEINGKNESCTEIVLNCSVSF